MTATAFEIEQKLNQARKRVDEMAEREALAETQRSAAGVCVAAGDESMRGRLDQLRGELDQIARERRYAEQDVADLEKALADAQKAEREAMNVATMRERIMPNALAAAQAARRMQAAAIALGEALRDFTRAHRDAGIAWPDSVDRGAGLLPTFINHPGGNAAEGAPTLHLQTLLSEIRGAFWAASEGMAPKPSPGTPVGGWQSWLHVKPPIGESFRDFWPHMLQEFGFPELAAELRQQIDAIGAEDPTTTTTSTSTKRKSAKAAA